MTDASDRLVSQDPLVRIEAKIEKLQGTVKAIETMCPICREELAGYRETIHGKDGVMDRLKAVETGRVDTLSVKSINNLIKGIVALATGVAAAVAVIVTSVAKLLLDR